MNRPKIIRRLSAVSAALSGIGIMLNIVIVLNPHIAAVMLGYGSIKELMGAAFSDTTQGLMLAQAAVPSALAIMSGINCFADKVSRSRSLGMLIGGVSAYIGIAALTNVIYTMAIRSAVADSMETVQLISSVTTLRGIISYLYIFSFVILMCSASVEYYIACEKASQ